MPSSDPRIVSAHTPTLHQQIALDIYRDLVEINTVTTGGSEDPFRVSPECFAAEQTVPDPEDPNGVIRCAYEQLPPSWWSQRLFLPLKAPRPQLVGGVQGMDIRLVLPLHAWHLVATVT
jgi:hypothetical protein